MGILIYNNYVLRVLVDARDDKGKYINICRNKTE